MATAADARRDLTEKIKLERQLADEIRVFNRKLVRNTIKDYGLLGRPFDASVMGPELTDILDNHYNRVSPSFDSQITDVLPADIAATPQETVAIASALALFFTSRAPQQSEIITATNQRDINSSIELALMDSQEEIFAGAPPQTRMETAFIVGAILGRKLTGRVTGISTLETQASAEAAKATEAQILIGEPPSVTGGTLRETAVTKEWVTVGDERVRLAHMSADSQEQTLNKAFDVGGQSLRWPGDTSLGASAANVINCRCSSVVNKEDVFAERRRRGEEISIEATVSEQLLISIGG